MGRTTDQVRRLFKTRAVRRRPPRNFSDNPQDESAAASKRPVTTNGTRRHRDAARLRERERVDIIIIIIDGGGMLRGIPRRVVV